MNDVRAFYIASLSLIVAFSSVGNGFASTISISLTNAQSSSPEDVPSMVFGATAGDMDSIPGIVDWAYWHYTNSPNTDAIQSMSGGNMIVRSITTSGLTPFFGDTNWLFDDVGGGNNTTDEGNLAISNDTAGWISSTIQLPAGSYDVTLLFRSLRREFRLTASLEDGALDLLTFGNEGDETVVYDPESFGGEEQPRLYAEFAVQSDVVQNLTILLENFGGSFAGGFLHSLNWGGVVVQSSPEPSGISVSTWGILAFLIAARRIQFAEHARRRRVC
jgi:hypothetical protein